MIFPLSRRLLLLLLPTLMGLIATSPAWAQPDLTVTKSNDTMGAAIVGESFVWSLKIENGGDQAAFISAALFLADVLPDSGLTYGTPTVTASNGQTGTVSCSISNDSLSCLGFSLNVNAGGDFTIGIPVTADASGSYTNPRGVCTVDLTGVVVESDETNNNCNSDTVVVTTGATGPDLTALKTNDVSGSTELAAGAFTWNVQVGNGGGADASFTNGQSILVDNLPNSNISYGTATITASNDITGTIDCAISNSVLTCSANGAVTLTAGTGNFTVSFDATPTVAGSYVNPRSGASCSADPGNAVTEDDETNNDCADTVSVANSPDLTATKTNDIAGAGILNTPFTWSIKVDNIGLADYSQSSSLILLDNLPESNMTYGTPSVSASSGLEGTIGCMIESAVLTCSPSTPVTLDASSGSFTISFTATPTAVGTFDNPRSGGLCGADPLGEVLELSEVNNSCSDSVIVTSGVTGPDLTVAKSNDVEGMMELADGDFTWSLKVSNGGDQDATFTTGQTILTDEMPTSNLTYGSVSISDQADLSGTGSVACSITNSVLTCQASGGTVIFDAETGTFTASFTVTPAIPTTYANPRVGGVCSVDPSDVVSEGEEGNNACGDSVEVAGSPDLTATKTNDTGGVAEFGVPFTWSIEVKNEGNADFEGGSSLPVVADGLPDSGLTYGDPSVGAMSGLTGSVDCTISASQVLLCNPTTLVIAPNGGFTVSWTATPTATGTFENPRSGSVCSADSANTDREIDESNNGCADTVVVPALASLSLTKTDSPDAVAAGAELTYDFSAPNAGPDTAEGVMVYDVLPAGLTYDDASSSSGCSQPSGFVGLLSALDASQVTPPTSSAATGVATLVLDDTTDELRFALAVSGLTNTITGASLRLSDGTLVRLLYQGTPVFDDGSSIAGIVQLSAAQSDALQVAASHILRIDTDAEPAGEIAGVVMIADDPVRCDLGDVISGAQGSAQIVADVGSDQSGAQLDNLALVEAATGDPNATALPNGTLRGAAAFATTSVGAETDLSITKTESADPATAGTTLTYSILIENLGPSDSTGATVTDPLPAGTSFVSSTTSCTESGGTVTCPIGALGPAGSETVDFTVMIGAGQTAELSNTATVAANETDPNSANDSSTETTSVATSADLSLIKDDVEDPVAGDTFTYSLQVMNAGPSDARNVIATDVLPAELSFLASADSCTDMDGTVTCDFGTLAAGGSASADFTVRLDRASAPAVVANTATVTSSDPDPDSKNNTDQEMTTLDPVAPTVSLVNSSADTGDGELAECESVLVDVQQLIVTFSETMADPSGDSDPEDASNPDNYQLVQAGNDRTFQTSGCGQALGDDQLVIPSSLIYDGGLNTATADFGSALSDGLYRLLVCATLEDSSGNTLDGDGDGSGDDDFVRNFRVDSGNLLVGGHLDCDLADWQTVSTNPSEIVWNADDARASGDSGSAQIEPLSSGTTFRLEQCLELPGAGGQAHYLDGQLRLSSATSADLAATCTFYDGVACSGSSLGSSGATSVFTDTAGSWLRFVADVTPAVGTVSATCAFELETQVGASAVANLDVLSLNEGVAPFFFDDFESGDLSAWTSSTP